MDKLSRIRSWIEEEKEKRHVLSGRIQELTESFKKLGITAKTTEGLIEKAQKVITSLEEESNELQKKYKKKIKEMKENYSEFFEKYGE